MPTDTHAEEKHVKKEKKDKKSKKKEKKIPKEVKAETEEDGPYTDAAINRALRMNPTWWEKRRADEAEYKAEVKKEKSRKRDKERKKDGYKKRRRSPSETPFPEDRRKRETEFQ